MCAKIEYAKKRCAKFEVERKLSELRYCLNKEKNVEYIHQFKNLIEKLMCINFPKNMRENMRELVTCGNMPFHFKTNLHLQYTDF